MLFRSRDRIVQIIRRRDDHEVDAVRVGRLGRRHFLIRGIAALEEPLGGALARNPWIGLHRPRDDLGLTVELRRDAMHGADECATAATHDPGAQASRWPGNGVTAHAALPAGQRSAWPVLRSKSSTSSGVSRSTMKR